ncbi:MAG: acyltransferase domain-containing protein, partial [Myxococcales bacterium]|nr:acyltransferase domain-containing protein [Myxococcales bacterium]
ALARVWQGRGLRMDAVLGHSMGEIAAACVAGALSLDDGARVIARRSRIARELAAGRGEMAVVELTIAEAEAAVADHARAQAVAVAVHNGPRSCVLSGEPAALSEILVALEARGVFCRRVKVDYASHSPLMLPLIEPVRDALAALEPRAATVPMLSTVRADWIAGEALTPDYWATNLAARVRFAEAIERLASASATGPSAAWGTTPRVFLEIGPHPVLTAAIADAARADRPLRALASLRRGEDDGRCITEVLEAVGAVSDARADDPGDARADDPRLRELSSPAFAAGLRVVEGRLDPRRTRYLDDHRVGGARVVAGAELALAASAAIRQLGLGADLEALTIPTALVLAEAAPLQVLLRDADEHGQRLELLARAAQSWTLHLRGRRATGTEAIGALIDDFTDDPALARRPDVDALYRELGERGLDYGPAFRRLRALSHDGRRFAAVLGTATDAGEPGPWARAIANLDAAFQALVSLSEGPGALVPVAIERLSLPGDPAQATAARGWIRRREADGGLLGDVALFDDAGTALAWVRGLELAPLTGLRTSAAELIEARWQRVSPGPRRGAARVWLIGDDD